MSSPRVEVPAEVPGLGFQSVELWASGPHLHLEVIRDGVPQNPRNYL